jgi:hypothetical protein
MVARHPPQVLEDSAERVPDAQEFESFGKTQTAMIKSRFVLNTPLHNPKVATLAIVGQQTDPAGWLEKNLQVTFDKDTGILRIALDRGDLAERVVLVDAVATAYLRESVEDEVSRRQKRLDQLKRLHADADNKLRDKRDTLQRLLGNVAAGNDEFARKRLLALQDELLQTQSEIRRVEVKLQLAEAQRKDAGKPISPKEAVDAALARDAEASRRQQEIAQLEETLSALRDRSPRPELEPGYQRHWASLQDAKRALDARRELLLPDIIATLQEQEKTDSKTEHARYQKELVFLKGLQRALVSDIEAAKELSKQRGVNVDWLREDIDHLQDLTRKINAQQWNLEVNLDAPPRVRLAQAAVLAD